MSLPSHIGARLDSWRTRARTAREEFHDERTARMIEGMIEEMEESLQAELDELLPPPQAETFSGTGRDHLRRTVENRGRPYAPLYRKGDLPLRPRSGSGTQLSRILLLAAETPTEPQDDRREQIRRQARETAQRKRLAG